MLLSWVAFPVAAIVVCVGLGGLVDWCSGRTTPPALIPPVGLALLVCLTQITTAFSWSAQWTVPVVLVATAIGLGVGWPRRRELAAVRWFALGAALALLVTGLPALAFGAPTFAGYTVLADTVVHIGGAEVLLEHGRSLEWMQPSNFASTMQAYYSTTAYPSGGATTLGALARIVDADAVWVFQPMLSLLVATLALAVATLVRPLVGSDARAAAAGFVAAVPATLMAFAMQGGLKEVAVVALLTTLAAALRQASQGAPSAWRAVAPIAVTVAASIGVLGPAAVIWAGPLLVGWFVISRVEGTTWRELAVAVAVLAAATGLLALQTLQTLDVATSTATSVASVGEVGNLLRPLSLIQALGVWLTGDFRVSPTGAALVATRVFEVVLVVASIAGAVWCARRRDWIALVFVVTAIVGAVFVVVRSSPWADAKALAIVSSPVLMLAMVGALGGLAARSRPVGIGVAAVLALGVLATNALIYRSASLAPHDRLEQLARINASSPTGPVLFNEFDEFAPYFLRDVRPEPAALLVVSPGDGATPARGELADLDGMTWVDRRKFPTLVTRRGPLGSRPSSVYSLAESTDGYDVWSRTKPPGDVIEHAALGTTRAPAAPADCATVRRLAGVARKANAKLAYATRPTTIATNPAQTARPDGWRADPDDPEVTLPSGGGEATSSIDIPDAAHAYDVWIEGSFGRRTSVLVDGESVGSVQNELSGRRSAHRLGTVKLDAGAHSVTVRRDSAGLAPGAGGLFRSVGPVYLVERGAPVRVHTVAASDWRDLCGKPADWVEVVR